jgi:hypothetical protein
VLELFIRHTREGWTLARSDLSEGESGRQLRRTKNKANPWIERLARLGYTSKGFVYAVIGVLALGQALGVGGKTTGTGGAVKTLGSQPFGIFLLVVVGVGLLGYMLWKFVQAIADTEDKGSDAKGIARRIGYAGSGVIHGGLAFTAAQAIVGSAGGSSSQSWTASLMAEPLGAFLVAAVALGVIGVCIYQLHAAYKAKFQDDLKLGEMSAARKRWTIRIGRTGITARALVIGVAGAFLLLAAYQSDPSETRGLGGALETLSNQPFGPYLLGATALGLLAYAIFMLLIARHRRVDNT